MFLHWAWFLPPKLLWPREQTLQLQLQPACLSSFPQGYALLPTAQGAAGAGCGKQEAGRKEGGRTQKKRSPGPQPQAGAKRHIRTWTTDAAQRSLSASAVRGRCSDRPQQVLTVGTLSISRGHLCSSDILPPNQERIGKRASICTRESRAAQ